MENPESQSKVPVPTGGQAEVSPVSVWTGEKASGGMLLVNHSWCVCLPASLTGALPGHSTSPDLVSPLCHAASPIIPGHARRAALYATPTGCASLLWAGTAHTPSLPAQNPAASPSLLRSPGKHRLDTPKGADREKRSHCSA